MSEMDPPTAESFPQPLSFSAEARVIVVAMDSSASSFAALDWAIDMLIPRANKDIVIALYVKQPIDKSLVYDLTDAFVKVENKLDERARAIEAAVEEHARAKGVPVLWRMVRGEARKTVCDEVQTLGASVLVMGSRGLGAIKRTIMGSVSQYCVQNASCPVVVIRKGSWDPDEEDGAKAEKAAKAAAYTALSQKYHAG